ncbi:MAG: hypothetical protein COA57_00895 [Flavobacteriales bacterium]|nr:MAG: hypothetical protein COA57_00895 [Flavobacteriales bacterium]
MLTLLQTAIKILLQGIKPILAFVFIGIFIFQSSSHAQQYNFRTYSLKEGMPQSQVLSMCQDSRGNIWFGTYGGGVGVFNGMEFKTITTKDGLANNSVWAIMEDRQGNIWIGTDGGISVHDGHQLTTYTTADGLNSNKVWSIMEDRQGNIWIGTDGGGLNLFVRGKFFNASKKSGRECERINTLFEDSEGKIWISCYGNGVVVIDGKKKTHITEKDGLTHSSVNCFKQDANGDIWAGTDAGITIFHNASVDSITEVPEFAGKSVTAFYEDENGYPWLGTYTNGIFKYNGRDWKNITVKNGLSSDHIYCIIQDINDNLWFGTDGGGACKYGGETFVSYTTVDGLSYNVVMAVHEDIYGNIWFGTDGKGLNKFDGKEFTVYSTETGFNSDVVTALEEDYLGNMWIGTDDAGIFKYDGKTFTHYTEKHGLTSSTIFDIFEDKDGTLWIATEEGVTVYDGNSFGPLNNDSLLTDERITAIAADKNWNIWLGTENGVAMYDGNKTTLYTRNDGLPSNTVTSIASDLEGNIWFGTDKGLSFYNGKHFINYTENEGLTSANIYLLTFGSDGHLFSGTEKGIDKISFTWDYKIENLQNYSVAEGFKGIECNANAAYKDKENNLWFGTVKGVTKYNPQFEEYSTEVPKVKITALRMFLEEFDWSFISDSITRWSHLPKNLVLRYDHNHLTFEFIGIQYDKPEKVRYQFKLDGFETLGTTESDKNNWSPTTYKREITYSNLPPGEYTFKVKAANDRDEWSQPIEFSFRITPPFWQTWWFYLLCGAGLITLIYFVILLRTKRLARAKRILEDQVAERTHEIMRQKEELEKLSIVASEIDNGVVISDKNNLTLWLNEGYTRITGYTLEELKGKKPGDIVVCDKTQFETLHRIRDKAGKKESYSEEVLIRTKSDEDVWIEISNTPVLNEKDELLQQIEIIKDITERKNAEEEIARKNKDITENILYARKIQEAVMPSVHRLYKEKPDSFILQMPRDIVSGDFCWFSTTSTGLFVMAVADCTGHGVAGALMSMVANEFLHQIIGEKHVIGPHEVLNELDIKIKDALHKKGREESKEGMDIAICGIDFQTNVLQYCGAYRPVIIIRKEKIIELHPDKFSVGIAYRTKKEYNQQTMKLQPDDVLYLFTDGYTDQFGGEKGKKFLLKRFKELLLEIHKLPMIKQKEILFDKLEQWKGEKYNQVDDILVVGMRV